MTNRRTSVGIAQLLQTVCARDAEGQTDGQLLGKFLAHRDQAAFAALLRRHGPMVLGVCHRLLVNPSDAEDAFQATFLVLVRKAATVASRAVLEDWLHGVARRTALNARRLSMRRWEKERATARPEMQGEYVRNDWLPLLDEELTRLPEKYRLPIVLCDLEGMTRRQAARHLGWPEGTVAGRLARARTMLAKRLSRRGLVMSGGTLATLLSQNAVSAPVPTSVVSSTIHTATWVAAGQGVAAGAMPAKVAALMEAVLKSMLLAKLRAGAMLLALVVGVLVADVIGRQAFAQKPVTVQGGPRQAEMAEDQPGPANTDLFGDPLPPGALVRMGTIRFAQGDSCNSRPVLAPDQKTFVTVSNYTPYGKGRLVCLWDTATGKEIRHFHDPDFEHYQAVFLKSADLLATVGMSRKPIQDKTHAYALNFWDLKTGKKTPQQIQTLGYHFEPWALSPDEKWLASAGRTPPVLVRDLKTGQQFAWQGDGSRVNQLVFSPDGNHLAIGCENKIHFWDWRNNREIHQLAQNDVERLWFSPDGKWLAGSIHQEGVRVWDTATFTEVRRFKDPDRDHHLVPGASYPHSVRFFPDSKKLVSTVTGVIWDVALGKPCGELEDFEVCSALEFAQDGKTATAYCRGRIRRWDAATGKALAPPLPYPTSGNVMIHQLGFLPDGKTVASASPDGAVRLWDATTGKELRTLAPAIAWDHRHINYLRVAADGTIIVVRNKRMTLFKKDKAPQEIALTEFPGDNLVSVNVSSNGKYLVLAGSDQKQRLVQLWDLSERTPAASFVPSEQTHLETLGISADGRHIVAGVGETLCLLNAGTGEIARTLDARPEQSAQQLRKRGEGGGGYGYFHGIQALSFSPEPNLLVAYGHPCGELKLLDVFSEKTRHVLRPGCDDHYDLRNAVFSADGKMLAAEADDGFVDVWETLSGLRRRRFLGHRSYQTTFAFAPDCTKLASGNRDATILVWDIFDLYAKESLLAQSPTQVELTAAWTDMKDRDAQRAALAMGRMMRWGDTAVRFLSEHLRQNNAEAAQLKKWLVDLDSDEFQKRETGMQELEKCLMSAYPLLEAAMADNPSLEMRQRIRRLLHKLEFRPLSPEKLRELRGLEVLEHIGTQAAEEVVRAIAVGNYDPWLAQAAKAAQERLLAKSP